MLPPPDRINYAEMRIQKVQIPVQVPIFKPIYVDYPYPDYIWTQDAQQATMLRAKQGMQTILANPQIKNYLINDDSSEESSNSDSEEEQQVQTQENKATLQNQQQVANKNINAQNYVNGAQQFVNANQQIEVGQNQQIRPPIQLDFHDSGYQKSQLQINNSYTTNKYPTSNIVQGRNDTTVSKNISMGRQHLEKFKSQLNQSNLLNQRQQQNPQLNTFLQ
ncbi:unnamed protein product (macronuclear) [Paramecium tetraurelia]|uniref:Uncharacterized protein n=1 Tax=Paramecium tetraurelia TaxID=5888 RepID=A0DZP9_PARTE|nr:uncharacterized protein GSPATT00021684001 [Paramecium tetraurelia]CAK88516.1 unnamed protein product [Paramecium tetraurelia]|eukprot:XP_001455913.1 hypothetical protein (macronuclear) [Paramecium tetraurelia strain d4-2]